MILNQSILDTDLYEFSMSYAFFKLFPEAEGEFLFNDRGKIKWTDEEIDSLKSSISANLYSVHLTEEEFYWVRDNIPYIPTVYWEWLKGFRFDPMKVEVWKNPDDTLGLSFKDKLYKSTLYEVILLAIVSEFYHTHKDPEQNLDEEKYIENLRRKIEFSNSCRLKFADMGTRRRYSASLHKKVVKTLSEEAKYCTGTSNVLLAKKTGLTPIGTCAHLWFMFHGSIFGYRTANYLALENWASVFDGDLGIALSDTFGSNIFFKNLSKKLAKLFDGLRHDSGDEKEFVDKAISRYKEHGINPQDKTIIFSNGLNLEKYKSVSEYCRGKIRCAAGIGTDLTCDTENPTRIVIKLSKCRMNSKQVWSDCVKISDEEGKEMGNPEEVKLCKDSIK